MLKGKMGRMLFINLSTGEIEEETPVEELYRDFLGGYGIGAKILFSKQKQNVDPLGPDNNLGFVAGLLTGTPAFFGNRYTIVGKSPLTGTWGDANSGGEFGPFLKFAGCDAVFFNGISDNPVYVYLEEGKAKLKDATDIWGMDTCQTEDILKDRHGKDVKVACIGPAGELQSLISCIITDKGRAAARSGLGAVMGSKKLKAVVVRGSMEVPLADSEKVKELRKKYLPKIKEHPLKTILGDMGTHAGTERNVGNGRSPVKNWAGVGPRDFANANRLSVETADKLHHKKYGCWRCPIACGSTMKAGVEFEYKEGAHKPEYETACAFGAMCLNDNYESIVMANDICNRYGIDTMSAGSTVAFAIECFENGLISKEDTEGIELNWGASRAIVTLTEKMAKREGFGALLADGVKIAAEKIGKGTGKYAMHVGGQEVPMQDPKAFPAYGITYTIDATPGRHTSCGNEEKVSGKEQRIGRCLLHAYSAAGLCLFYLFMGDHDMTIDLLNSITGQSYTIKDLIKIGERIANLRQAFNLREGINIMERRLPERVRGNPPQSEGPNANVTLDPSPMIKEYMQEMDWDEIEAKPSKKKLQELGLNDVAAVLWPNE